MNLVISTLRIEQEILSGDWNFHSFIPFTHCIVDEYHPNFVIFIFVDGEGKMWPHLKLRLLSAMLLE